jgi:quercetin dioxygenase-like cupin family protein
MRLLTFTGADDTTAFSTADVELRPMGEFDGRALRGVTLRVFDLRTLELQLVGLDTGGHFVMHGGPVTAVCQVIAGAGRLRVPSGETIEYRSGDVIVFEPDALHEWLDVTADTLLSIVVRTG